MKVKATFSGFDLTEGKIYEVIFEYDTVYDLRCDTGRYCRDKGYFDIVEEDGKADGTGMKEGKKNAG